jgi:hypothetical protein
MTKNAGLTILAVALLLSACGSGGNGGSAAAPPLTGTTAVTLVLGSTGNDRLAEYDVSIAGITLTSRSGKTVTLLASTQQTEFVHVNGAVQPLLTATVPQDVYVAAAVSISDTALTCLSLNSLGGVDDSVFADNGTPPVTNVMLPQTITITGMSLALELEMQVSQSATFSSCAGGSGATFEFTPTFVLSAFDLPTAATSASPVLGTLDGQVTAVDVAGARMQLTLAPQSPATTPLTIETSAGTVNQGFAGIGALAVGQFVQVDGSLQADGSVLASRIALADPVAVDVQEGPIILIPSSVPYLQMYPLMEQGPDQRIDTEILDFANASFHIGGAFSNLASLPFIATFTAATMVAGQNVYITTPVFNYEAPPDYTGVATTITLEPQTLNGTVVATGTSGSFAVYTVQLAAYDLFPALAEQPGQTTLLANPSFVQVYVDATTQHAGTTPAANGALLRFYGLVFIDGGTLRMDCGRIDDGVTP